MKKLLKIIIMIPIALVILVMLFATTRMKLDASVDYDVVLDDSKIPQFT